MTPEREKEIRELAVYETHRSSPARVRDGKVIGELLEEIDGLRESIRIYGGHCGGCPAHESNRYKTQVIKCSCGFRQVWIEQVENKKNERTESNQRPSKLPGSI